MNDQLTEPEIRIRCAEIEGIPPKKTCFKIKWWEQESMEVQYGFTIRSTAENSLARMVKYGCEPIGVEEYETIIEPPDYCNSIDAINAAVLRLSEEKRGKWVSALTDVLIEKTPGEDSNVTVIFLIATASALDRCKAFLKVHE